MATYAIGDVQGCFEPLERLLKQIQFDPAKDTLWFAGDLVNRGPQSLQTLRFIKSLGRQTTVVLGNHDLHLLAIYYGGHAAKRNDTLDAVLVAEDAPELLNWLRHQPLVHSQENWCMSHAGIPPQWTVAQALALSKEVEAAIQGEHATAFFQQMYGNQSNSWQAGLTGIDRLRTIVNYLTRMRFIGPNGELDLVSKEGLDTQPSGYVPWFNAQPSYTSSQQILFGHWAALEGKTNITNVHALDTGCVWGGQLSALRLEDQQWFRVPATTQQKTP